jgi:hypothetical protein
MLTTPVESLHEYAEVGPLEEAVTELLYGLSLRELEGIGCLLLGVQCLDVDGLGQRVREP